MRIVSALIFVWLLIPRGGVADDIDIYLHSAAASTSYVHVLLDLDNTDRDRALCTYGVDCAPPFMTREAYAQLDGLYADGDAVTAVGVFKAVLAAVVDKPLLDELYLSLLISNHQDNLDPTTGRAVGGGTLLAGYQRLGDKREQLQATLKSLPVLSSASAHLLQPRESFFEWLRYLQGGPVALGTNTVGNFGQASPSPDYDSDIITGGKYLAPLTNPDGCPRLYSIIFSTGSEARDTDLSPEISSAISLAPDVSFEQLLAYMHDDATDLLPLVSNRVSLSETWVVSRRGYEGKAGAYARAGGSEAVMYVDEPVVLEKKLTEVLRGVISVSGSFLAASAPADTFNQGRVLDNIYVSLFKPRATLNWPGNLKKLKLLGAPRRTGVEGLAGISRIVDVHGNPAFEQAGSNMGRIRFDALSFWTDVATLPPGEGVVIPKEADGREVTRGGAGQKIDGFANYSDDMGDAVSYFIGDTNADPPVEGYQSRQLFYEPSSGSEFLPFDASVDALADLGPLLDPRAQLSNDEMMDLIRWGRGQDVENATATATATATARHWIMGDILHSRPYALNYGATPGYSETNPNIRILLGSGDGVFHIIENTDSAGHETGREVFGFYPRELLGGMQSRRADTLPAGQMRYGVDGEPVVYRFDRNGDGTLDYTDGDEAYVYFGLRRGGRSYFGLDISNPSATPTLLWKISPFTDTDFGELGLGFSTPVLGKVKYAGAAVDVLVFAGGYDGGWNADYSARLGKDLDASDNLVGNAIYIVDARTGELVWKAVQGATGNRSNSHYAHAGLVDSIPSAVTALKSPGGFIHRLYVGDSGGALWRVDLPPNVDGGENHRRDNWFITKLADLGSDAAEAGGTAANDLRFFHAPEVVRTFDDTGDLDGVLIQSGNRADPSETVVENYLFYLKDRETVSGSPAVRARNDASNPAARYTFADLRDQSACITGAEAAVAGAAAGGEDGACNAQLMPSGWKIRFERPGEKGLSRPLVDAGRVFATTFIPGSSGECPPQEGQGHAYVLRLADATAVANKQRVYDLGPGIPPAVVRVGDSILLPGDGADLYDLDGDGVRDSSKLLPSQAKKLYRIYWRESGIDPL